MCRTWLLLALVLVSIPSLAATITGNIYGPELERVAAVIEVNTTPPTRIVANGSYSLELPEGTYSLVARTLDGQYSSEDTIRVSGNGSARFDIVAIPSMDIEHVPSIDPGIDDNGAAWPVLLGIPVAVAAAIAVAVVGRRRIRGDMDEHAMKAVEILKGEGRMLQKELRRRLGLSEAKVSMIVAELEHAGLIKKIKKGRGNVLVFSGRK